MTLYNWLFFLGVVLFTACSPCRRFAQTAERCDDLAEGWTVASATAQCEDAVDEADGYSRTTYNCLLSCMGDAPTCVEYYDRAYFSCECLDRCNLDCEGGEITEGDDDSAW